MCLQFKVVMHNVNLSIAATAADLPGTLVHWSAAYTCIHRSQFAGATHQAALFALTSAIATA